MKASGVILMIDTKFKTPHIIKLYKDKETGYKVLELDYKKHTDKFYLQFAGTVD